MNAVNFFSREEKELIKSAVREAELKTSGEIRVHLDNHCREEVLDRAAWWFGKLEMNKTGQRNGVLFYLAVKDHKFAILGDAGINAVTPENFWEKILPYGLIPMKPPVWGSPNTKPLLKQVATA